jgi:hypothetical protein
MLAFPVVVAPPAVHTVALRPATARVEAEFRGIDNVRELPGDTLLVMDRSNRGLLAVDLKTGRTRSLARIGKGPGEHAGDGQAVIVSLGRDSTLLSDFTMRRWYLYKGTKLVTTVGLPDRAISASMGWVNDTDDLGHVLSVINTGNVQLTRENLGVRPVDSSLAILASRVTGQADTITKLRGGHWLVREFPARNGQKAAIGVSSLPLSEREQAVLFPDGWVGVVRLDPYRVDWRSPKGKWTRGAALPVPTVRMDPRERQAVMLREASAEGREPRDPSTMVYWPDAVPTLVTGPALRPSPEGNLVVARAPSAARAGTRYDIIDRNSKLVAELTLTENEKLLGFGINSILIQEIDDNGIAWIRRHPWAAVK